MENNSNKKWLILTLCCLGMASMAITIQDLTPVSHAIQKALDIDFGKLGFLMGAISIPGIFLSLPGGMLADRWGKRTLIFAGYVLMILGAALFTTKLGYNVLYLSRLISGIGCICISVLLPGIVTSYFKGKSLGMAMGIFNTALPLGSIVTLSFFGQIGNIIGPFRLFWIPAIFTSLVLIMSIFFLHGKEEQKPDSHKFEIPPLNSPIWILGLIILFANMSTMGYVTIAPSYFTAQKFSIPVIGLMLSAVLWGTLFLSPVAGLLTSHWNMAKILIIGGCLFQGIWLILIPIKEIPLSLDLIFFTISAGVIITPVYILVPRVIPIRQLNMGYGIIMTAMMLGCFLGSSLSGLSVNYLGGFHAGFESLGFFSFAGAIAAIFLKREVYIIPKNR
ncbi:MAG: MFS transporter [Candidatus Eremiobacteraeota bacterium]|nr:MFS transporter [Candidatus Eremiobacteraeota bacterium]